MLPLDHHDNVHPRGRKAFDVFELDHRDEADVATDEVRSGSSRTHPRLDRVSARLRRVDRTDRRLAVGTVIALAIAVLAGTKAVQAHQPVRHVTHTTVIPAPRISVDALGCPAGRRCDTDTSPAPVLAAVRSALPSGQVTYAVMEVDRDSGEIYRIEVDIAAPHTSIRVVSSCVPGSAPVTGEPIAVRLGLTGDTISGDRPTPSGLKEWTITLASPQPGNSSCGITVSAESTLTAGIDGQAIDTVVNLLADDPRLMAVAT